MFHQNILGSRTNLSAADSHWSAKSIALLFSNLTTFFFLIGTLSISSISVSTAAETETNPFYMVIASDPQLPWECTTEACKEIAKTVEEQAVLSNHWQAQSINAFAKTFGDQLKGVIINGDLTAFGHKDELKSLKDNFLNLISAPLFPGLGNHDYANNINDCWNNNCADRMLRFMVKTVAELGSRIHSFDLQESPTHYKFPIFVKHYRGSFSYSFDIQKVRFIQLQNYPGYTVSLSKWHFSKARRDIYTITPSFDWLENELKQAQLDGKTTVLNMHDFEHQMTRADQQRTIELMKKYSTAAVFWGHFHQSMGRRFASDPIPGFISGSSSANNYLLVKFENNQPIEVLGINAVTGKTEIVKRYSISGQSVRLVNNPVN